MRKMGKTVSEKWILTPEKELYKLFERIFKKIKKSG